MHAPCLIYALCLINAVFYVCMHYTLYMYKTIYMHCGLCMHYTLCMHCALWMYYCFIQFLWHFQVSDNIIFTLQVGKQVSERPSKLPNVIQWVSEWKRNTSSQALSCARSSELHTWPGTSGFLRWAGTFRTLTPGYKPGNKDLLFPLMWEKGTHHTVLPPTQSPRLPKDIGHIASFSLKKSWSKNTLSIQKCPYLMFFKIGKSFLVKVLVCLMVQSTALGAEMLTLFNSFKIPHKSDRQELWDETSMYSHTN